jgi:hypothetical protein
MKSIASGHLLRLQQEPAIAERRHTPEFCALVRGCSKNISRDH